LTVLEGGTAIVLDGGNKSVLDNDFEDDIYEYLTASIDTPPANGNLTLFLNGEFIYTHNGTETTTDSFIYIASDGDLTDTATVTINITPINDAPVAINDDYEMKKGNILEVEAPGVLENDSDAEHETLLVTAKTFTRNGQVILNADGSFIYTPSPTFSGETAFNYEVCDPVDACVEAEVTIDVVSNIVLTANADTAATNEDKAVVIDVLANDIDPDGNLDPSSLGISSPPSDGSAEVGPEAGEITYDPDLNFFGPDEFNYIICDNIGGNLEDCKIATVTVNVSSVNDAPVAKNDTYHTPEDEALIVLAPGLLANDSDVETPNASLIASLESDVSRGKLALNKNGSFTYTPPEGYIGIVSFTYKAYDGELYSNIVTVTITVGEDNEPPTISWLSPSIGEDEWIDVGTQIYPLEVNPLDNIGIEVVNFRRWEPSAGTNGDWVFLGSVSSSPYRIDLDTSTINIGFNQITAEAYDTSGNFSESNIFLRRWVSLVYMPVVSYQSD